MNEPFKTTWTPRMLQQVEFIEEGYDKKRFDTGIIIGFDEEREGWLIIKDNDGWICRGKFCFAYSAPAKYLQPILYLTA
jgi:hypothetical protein